MIPPWLETSWIVVKWLCVCLEEGVCPTVSSEVAFHFRKLHLCILFINGILQCFVFVFKTKSLFKTAVKQRDTIVIIIILKMLRLKVEFLTVETAVDKTIAPQCSFSGCSSAFGHFTQSSSADLRTFNLNF